MKEMFKDTKFKGPSLELIAYCDEVIREYQKDGLRLTLRQLYYQLVTKNVIPNVERSYKNLSTLVTDARMAGMLDWEAIEDRVRRPVVQNEFTGLESLVDAALRSYRLPRWHTQSTYVELWVEKDALAGVLRPLALEYHVTMMVNRGYSSASAMYESAKRFIDQANSGSGLTKRCVLLYLGDHDPSGEDMVRDIDERLGVFGAEVEVCKIALNMKQVRQYNPPPNPAKISDPRAKEYVKKYGEHSWEVDALPPRVLSDIIRREISQHVDFDAMEEIKLQEDKDKTRLRALVKTLKD